MSALGSTYVYVGNHSIQVSIGSRGYKGIIEISFFNRNVLKNM